MRVFVTGGTGFTGSQVVSLLLSHGHQTLCLYRPDSDRSHLLSALENVDYINRTCSGRSLVPGLPDNGKYEIEWVKGDLSDPQPLASSMKGADALVNLASLGFGHVDGILRTAKEAGIRRAIFISTTAIYTQLDAKSKSIRLAAEQSIRTSGLDYTILRPTMIYGSPRDRNMGRLIRFLQLSPIMPVFGDGTHLQQPIFVDDVARAIAGCLSIEQTIGKSYNIAGKSPLTYNQVIDTVAWQLKRRVWKIHIPSRPVVSLLRFLERFHILFPIKAEQVLRLNENKSFSYEDAQKDFGFTPLSFEEGIALELNQQQR